MAAAAWTIGVTVRKQRAYTAGLYAQAERQHQPSAGSPRQLTSRPVKINIQPLGKVTETRVMVNHR